MLITSPSSVDVLEAARPPQQIDDAAMDGEALDLDERRDRRIGCTLRSRNVKPVAAHRRRAGKRSTLNASSSTSLSSRSSSVATTSLRSGSVREPAAATMVSTTSVPTSRGRHPCRDFESHVILFSGLRVRLGKAFDRVLDDAA